MTISIHYTYILRKLWFYIFNMIISVLLIILNNVIYYTITVS